jgi:hypothetical protein
MNEPGEHMRQLLGLFSLAVTACAAPTVLYDAVRDASGFLPPHTISSFLILGDSIAPAGLAQRDFVEMGNVPEPTALSFAAIGVLLVVIGRARRSNG